MVLTAKPGGTRGGGPMLGQQEVLTIEEQRFQQLEFGSLMDEQRRLHRALLVLAARG